MRTVHTLAHCLPVPAGDRSDSLSGDGTGPTARRPARPAHAARVGRVGLLASLLLVTLAGCSSMFSFSRTRTYALDGVATFSLPAGWNRRGIVREPDYVLYELGKPQSWWLGAGTPLEAQAWVVLAAPGADEATLQAAVEAAFRRARVDTRHFPEFGSMRNGERETWINEGNYQIHSLHDPEKVLFVRSLDRARGVALVARVYLRKTPHEKLLRITAAFFDSLEVAPHRAAYFEEIRDWPSVRAERVRREVAHLNGLLETRGLPPAQPGRTLTHEGWVYTLWEDALIVGRLLGSRTHEQPIYRASGELAWLFHRDNEWHSWKPSDPVSRRGGPRFFSDSAPTLWATAMGPELDRSRVWFFTVRQCTLTGREWEAPRDPAACELDTWFDGALEVEQAFRANQLTIE